VGITTAEASRIRTEIVLAVVGLVLLLLLLAPMVARRLLRRSRLGPTTDPHDSIARAWLEVRDTWLDLGHRWPQGTPRQIADVVGHRLPDGVAGTSLSGVVSAVEQSRYSEHLDDVEGLRLQVHEVLSGLDASRPWYRRLGHVILPASLTYAARQWWRRVTTLRAPEAPVEETTHLTSPEDEAYQRPVGSATIR
jgi:hypothetical protein